MMGQSQYGKWEVGFIREKGKGTARAVQWSPETSGSLLSFYGRFNSVGGFFSLTLHFKGFLR
jgi:hypothetical protein